MRTPTSTRWHLTTKGGQSFGFDLGNRLTSSSLGGSYTYDGLGRRFRIASSDGSTRIQVYSQAGQILWATSTGGPRPNSTTAYIYLGGKQIAEVNSAAGVQYVHTDALGSPVAHTGANGALINRSRFEPYGYVAAGTKPSANSSVIGFTGHVQDAETDLVYMQQRYYDPLAGRFLSVDPVVTDANTGKGFALYTYVENNPYIYTDPDGRELKVDGSDEFKAKVANAMRWLSSQPVGAELVAQIVSTKTPLVTISETTGGNVTMSTDNKATFNGQPAGAKIDYNPNNSTGPAKDVNGSDQRPPAVGLGHELDHAVGIGKGADKAGLDAKGNKDVAGAKDKSEIRAIRTEQRIRAEHGLPARALTPAQRALDSQIN